MKTHLVAIDVDGKQHAMSVDLDPVPRLEDVQIIVKPYIPHWDIHFMNVKHPNTGDVTTIAIAHDFGDESVADLPVNKSMTKIVQEGNLKPDDNQITVHGTGVVFSRKLTG